MVYIVFTGQELIKLINDNPSSLFLFQLLWLLAFFLDFLIQWIKLLLYLLILTVICYQPLSFELATILLSFMKIQQSFFPWPDTFFILLLAIKDSLKTLPNICLIKSEKTSAIPTVKFLLFQNTLFFNIYLIVYIKHKLFEVFAYFKMLFIQMVIDQKWIIVHKWKQVVFHNSFCGLLIHMRITLFLHQLCID